VYGPTEHAAKDDFLLELRDMHAFVQGPWMLCGDFNMIYQASDQNTDRLRRGLMRRFRQVLDDLQLDELQLAGRLYTWSNHRDNPTLERLDRIFASVGWLEQNANHHLRCLSSDVSDHAALLLVLDSEPWSRPRFRFDDYWRSIPGFLDVVRDAWNGHVTASDPCRLLDQKFRAVAKALRKWRATKVGNVRLQLAAARAVIYELDTAEESRQLSPGEIHHRKELKRTVLGLASLCRTMARQRARTRQLNEGDACTRFFHLQACHRRRKNYFFAISHNGQTFTEEEAKADIVFTYYHGLLGTAFPRQHRIDLSKLPLPRLDLQELTAPFTAVEITKVGTRARSGRFRRFILQGLLEHHRRGRHARIPRALEPRL
jgi:hypothetical protein